MLKRISIIFLFFISSCRPAFGGPDLEKELPAITQAAERNSCRGNDLRILIAIRMHENGPPGLEFGVMHPRARWTCLDTQAGWAAATIVKNHTRWICAGRPGEFIDFLADRWIPPSVSPAGNANWKQNVKYFFKELSMDEKVIDLQIALPKCMTDNIAKQTLEIGREPEGQFLSSEVIDLEPDVRSVCVQAPEGCTVTLALVAFDDQNNASRPVRLNVRARKSAALVYDGEMIVAHACEHTEDAGEDEGLNGSQVMSDQAQTTIGDQENAVSDDANIGGDASEKTGNVQPSPDE